MSDSFNYIAFGNLDYVQDADEISVGRGRIFEYTPTEISKGLENLDQDSVNFIEKLPTFLCTEISRGDISLSMLVRYGYISETVVGRKEVATKFVPVIEFGEVEFDDIDQAAALFGFEQKFQLYRSHWAVRQGNLNAILTGLAERKPDAATDVAELEINELAAADAQPPPQKKNIIGVAESVEDFLKILEGRTQEATHEIFYRGHENGVFELTPFAPPEMAGWGLAIHAE